MAREIVDVGNLIAGQRVDSAETFEVIDPAETDRVVGRTSAADPGLVDQAVEAAATASADWAALTLPERVAALGAAATKAQEAINEGEWSRLLVAEQGKILLEAGFEVGRVGALVDVFGALAERALADEVVADDVGRREVSYRPFGVVAAVTPWNWPVSLTMGKVIPALVAGNTIVVKPAPTTPLTITSILDVMSRELPAGSLNVVQGGGAAGAALVAHPKVRKVAFTGSTANGRRVYASAADGVRSLTLELGGNDPAVVLHDVDLSPTTLDRMLQAMFVTTGQVCWAIKRVYVDRRCHDEFVDALLDRLGAYVVGPGLDARSYLGPLHIAPQRDKVRDLVAGSRAAGAEVHEAGELLGDPDRGYFLRPSLVTGLTPDAPLVIEEQFGPAVPVLPFDDIEQAVRLANDSEFGLCASVWSADVERGFAVARRLEAGQVFVNAHAGPALDYGTAIGGIKQSGIGREMGTQGLREYCEVRSVSNRVLRPPLTRSPGA
jgi:aldehyde dehydrogenase